ncbi:MAG TPA: TAT-variant-translocated molybdopterin oxidoreductase [Polyangiaceae bacterium]|nr:TAT-variant-translocated molybdopterin oxidoreductase [Polyangiaceae bacterium]
MSSVKDKSTPPLYWRSLEERARDPELLERLRHEFADRDPGEPSSQDRRRFMQVMGASLAFGAATGCRWQEDKLMPFTRTPEGMVPGVPSYYNTAMELNGHSVGLRVKSYDGRPIKIEGNPLHKDSQGAASAIAQAAILELYDPDRSRTPMQVQGGQAAPTSLAEFKKFARKHFSEVMSQRGEGLRVLTTRTSSPSFKDMKARFGALFPLAKWMEYEPVSDVNARAGSVLAFGSVHRAHYAFDKAKVILSLDADFLGIEPNSVSHSRLFASTRVPESETMSRLYAVESALSITGCSADHRLPLRSELIKAFTAALDYQVSQRLAPPAGLGVAQPMPAAPFLADAEVKKFFDALVKDLVANAGSSVVVAGCSQPAEVHALVHRLNAVLGNVPNTVSYTQLDSTDTRTDEQLMQQLADEIKAGRVSTVLCLDTNPVYNAPGSADFKSLLAKVKTTVHIGRYFDETARLSSFHAPLCHFLETWSDGLSWDGGVTLVQPLIAPLHESICPLEFLASVIRDSETTSLGIVRRTHREVIRDDRTWRAAVHDGAIPGTEAKRVTPELRAFGVFGFAVNELGEMNVGNGKLEISLALDSHLHDGRFANNGWLMECPDPVTKLTWDNAVLVNPGTAKELGIQNGALVEVSVAERHITVPALLSPGQAKGSLRLALGYGRTSAGVVAGNINAAEDARADSVGVNAFALRGPGLWHFGSGATVKNSGKSFPLATTQDKHGIDPIGQKGTEDRLPLIVRETTFEKYKEEPDFAKHKVHHPPLLSLWEEPVQYDGHRWGMSVDLNKCTGCGACVIACQAENNIPVVGKDRVMMGREMQWMRIDRYFSGDSDTPKVSNQPVMCQQCEHAPCEQVCPVGATQHNHEGLNDMTYNRCIGTRYCSNNCPYKVRRFNYFNFHEDMKQERNQVKGMVFNPEVTVRSRGVMEKCTYCVQRINLVKIDARNNQRDLVDGEIQTACQQTCPTGAIVFGDLNDKSSHVAQLQGRPRSYALLEELNIRPRTQYLAQVRNPNPELG